jgi:hypothetical protein
LYATCVKSRGVRLCSDGPRGSTAESKSRRRAARPAVSARLQALLSAAKAADGAVMSALRSPGANQGVTDVLRLARTARAAAQETLLAEPVGALQLGVDQVGVAL